MEYFILFIIVIYLFRYMYLYLQLFLYYGMFINLLKYLYALYLCVILVGLVLHHIDKEIV